MKDARTDRLASLECEALELAAHASCMDFEGEMAGTSAAVRVVGDQMSPIGDGAQRQMCLLSLESSWTLSVLEVEPVADMVVLDRLLLALLILTATTGA